jgi:hypothetical protein
MSTDRNNIWARLAAPLPGGVVAMRQEGAPVSRDDGTHVARFVPEVDADAVRERLDAVVAGEWDLTLELLPPLPAGAAPERAMCSFKARV